MQVLQNFCGGAFAVLLQQGVNIQQSPARCVELLNEVGICFFFAQKYHTSMKYVGDIRKELGFRTVFNILGPLTNPGSPKMQLLGVYGKDMLDEISLSAPTKVCEIKNGWFKSYGGAEKATLSTCQSPQKGEM